ncbi:hypothetical protein IQ266_18200 [filamentous cyanobacterium LEGE 11480]|uniref:Uncharacterized protein n=1 Tax=Romeriopsis navalis LEGE 11480 TaxID=2777977 RepID=A0A928Z5N6_9CYAN|nr:hypothetical protein [Romeriopsis navalis]MBE9031668.1 hypothetical protein [Romeriopsis navalis LEGE 11480]
MKLKQRKTLFLILMTLAAGGSMTLYGSLDGSFMSKTMQIVVLQQLVGAAIYLSCFGPNLVRSKSPFE